VTFNSRSTLMKKLWGSLDIHSSKDYGNVLIFANALDFWSEIKNKRFDAYYLTRLVKLVFYYELTILHCLILRSMLTLLRKLI